MSSEKNNFTYSMALLVLGGGVFLSTIICISAALDDEFLLVLCTAFIAFVNAVLFQQAYRKMAQAERGDLRGKDDGD